MEKNPDRQRPILVCGLVGIIGALLTIISDLILLGRPVNAVTFLKLGTASMANLAQWRITVGSFMGVIVLPAPVGGFIGPAYLNISILIFMALSTSVVWGKTGSCHGP